MAPISLIVCASCALIAGLEDKQRLADTDSGLGDGPSQEDAPPDEDTGAGPGIETIATDQNGAWGVAVDDTYVYWTDDRAGTVWRRDKALASPPEMIAQNQDNPRHMLVDAQYVYWTNSYGTTRKDGGVTLPAPIVMRVPRDATMPDAQAVFSMDASANFNHVTLRPGDPWLFAVSSSVVRRIAITPPDDASVATTNGTIFGGSAIGEDVDYVYWYSEGTHQAWRRLKTFTANNVAPFPEQIGPALDPSEVSADMAVDDQALWFGTGLGTIYRMEKVLYVDGGKPLDAAADADASTALVRVGDAGPNLRRIVSRDDWVYLARWTIGGDGEILAVSKTTGQAILVASQQSQPRDIAVDVLGDRTMVYWTNNGDGSVRRAPVPKP